MLENLGSRAKELVAPSSLSQLEHAGRTLAAVGLTSIAVNIGLAAKEGIQGMRASDKAIAASSFGAGAQAHAEAADHYDNAATHAIIGMGSGVLGLAGLGIRIREDNKKWQRIEDASSAHLGPTPPQY